MEVCERPGLHIGSVIWEGALILSDYLVTNARLLERFRHNPHVLELGSGTGLVGLVAAFLGGRVTLTDKSISLLEASVERNAQTLELADTGGSLRVERLEWGENTMSELSLPVFSYVLAADVLYSAASAKALLETFLCILQPKAPTSSGDVKVSLNSSALAPGNKSEDDKVKILLCHKERDAQAEGSFFQELDRLGVRVEAVYKSGEHTVYCIESGERE